MYEACPACGRPNANGAQVCAHCGQSLRPNVNGVLRPTLAAQAPGRRTAWRPRPSALLGLVIALLVVVLATSTILSAHAASTKVATQHALTPGPTTTFSPLTGFALYQDAESSFQMQYPQDWIPTAQHPGVEFDDNTQDPGYIVQVLLPTDAQDPTTDWVTYELEQLRKTTGATSFDRQDGVDQRQIGNETWSGGTAVLTVGEDTIEVQVFATVHQGKPYVLNLIVASDEMQNALATYFDAMLDSFAFLS